MIWAIELIGGFETIGKAGILVVTCLCVALFFTFFLNKSSYGFLGNFSLAIIGGVGGFFLLHLFFAVGNKISLIGFDNDIDYNAGMLLAIMGLSCAMGLMSSLVLMKIITSR